MYVVLDLFRFLITSLGKLSKTPSDGTLLERTSRRFLWCWLLLLLFLTHWRFFISLLFDIIPHPSVDYRRVFTPILYFQPSPSQSDSRHFHFQPFRNLLTASATVLSGRFLPTGVFYLTLLHWHFTCVYQGLPGSRQFFLEVCRGFILILKTQTRPICLFDSQ